MLLGPRCPFLQNPDVVCEGLAGAGDLAQFLDCDPADAMCRLVLGPIVNSRHDRNASWRGRCSVQTGSSARLSPTPSHPVGRPMRACPVGGHVHRQTSAVAGDRPLAEGVHRQTRLQVNDWPGSVSGGGLPAGRRAAGRRGPAGGRGSRSQGDERAIAGESFGALHARTGRAATPQPAGTRGWACAPTRSRWPVSSCVKLMPSACSIPST